MRVEQLGSGTPEIALIGGIHGDEPCGIRAIERLLSERPSVDRPVKLIIANERAIDRQIRYVDEDLNRAFPGSRDSSTHEGTLAAKLRDELDGCVTFSMHSTQSYPRPFAIVNGLSETVRSVCPHLPITAVVETGDFVDGRLFTCVETIEVECGLQGSDTATDNAYQLSRAFLAAMDAIPGEQERTELPVYELTRCIRKDEAKRYEVFVENFERVDPGDPFAAADDRTHVAEDAFYPVLMSSYGYSDVFGYAARKLDGLHAATVADTELP